ncbi:LysM peptidoglycan-binding domain-containing protein [Streptomyces atratus]|uniref:LysM peptidoglycan-binding domain-containing protein n=1 Tax=Streptomyces atratus TaxID=1893 RepID=UPI0022539170|nr:LysM peptidoglycan-binding domain-containing protein [Streptomyces atratus]MCX5338918.1 LysM peptidoglycan-binding domain-containing protein [Streptomyces atratus]
MSATGNHRRRKSTSLTRGLIVATTGGAALVLPLVGAGFASAAPAQSKAAASTVATVKEKTAQKAAPTIYSVIAGDTLSKIARGHSLSGGWKKLYEDNREIVGDNPAEIRPGMKLTIGAQAESKTSATVTAAPAATPATYTNDLNGWIKESLAVMAKHGIPGSYDGIHRNVMRESSGNPLAINNWDSNAAKGTPSKGLLQIIDPTFRAYHVPGTSMDSYDPIANITAACNYAADKYGSIDNVFGAY